MRLILGLGNPDPKYALTRHNVGFMVVRALAGQHKAVFRRSEAANALATRIMIGSGVCSLLLPLTYMNDSGIAAKAAAVKGGVPAEDILVIADDMAIKFGLMRLRSKGSAGGHNGIKSIIAHLGTDNFSRLRLGVGRPQPGVNAAEYVLSDFTTGERNCLPEIINQALAYVHSWVDEGVESAMNKFNQRNKT